MEFEPAAFALVGVALNVAAIWLGQMVRNGRITSLDRAGFRIRGYGVSLAIALTELGRGFGLSAVALIAFVVTWRIGGRESLIVALLLAQLLIQYAIRLLKRVVRRERPDVFHWRREIDLSYPSGHTASAILFIVGLAVMAARSHLPVALPIALAVVAGGIMWSRLALGAHYATDVLGGALIGAGALSLLASLALATDIAPLAP